MRSPAWTFSKVTSYWGSPSAAGWPRSLSIWVAEGLMSISAALTPSAFISAWALRSVRALVANPGSV